MSFTARLESVSALGDPTKVEIGVTYLDDAAPDWRVTKGLQVTLDPALTGAQQRAAIQAQVTADAQRYKTQLAAYAGLLAMVGSVLTI